MTASEPAARVRVRVPATSANLGPGFDAFGLALRLYDEITVEVPGAPGEGTNSGRSVHVEASGEGAADLPGDESHLVVRAIEATFAHLGRSRPPHLRLFCRNRIPHARGLGSSAAAIVAGVAAARALLPGGADELPDSEALRVASDLEGHPDNIAACLLGGLTIAWAGQDGAAAVRLEPADLEPEAHVPDRGMTTEAARVLLPETVAHADAAANAGRAGLLVGALTGAVTDPEAFLLATDDLLHQPYRAEGMPESVDLVRRLRAAGVPAVISGAGPTVLAFGRTPGAGSDPDGSQRFAPDFRSFPLGIDREGTMVWVDPARGVR